jgi:hypothetical protein
MADVGLLTVQVNVKQRSLAGRLVKLPLVFRKHYRVFRREGNGMILSAYGAWLLAGLMITVGKKGATA